MGMKDRSRGEAAGSGGRIDPPPEGEHRIGEEHFHFDLSLLADPDADPVARRREWARTYGHYTPMLHRYFARTVAQPTDRDDLVQHIWLRVLENLHTLRDPAVMWSWLLRTGSNWLTDRRRASGTARRNAEARPDELNNALQGRPAKDALANLTEEATPTSLSELEPHMGSLTAEERRLLEYRKEGRSHDEMAKLLGLKSAGASRKRLERALAKIRVSLDEERT